MAIQLMSNVKIITSGLTPTTANLLPGQAAFGKLTSDGKYHIFGNTGEGGGAGKVVDIVLDTYASIAAPELEEVLASGNDTTADILFKETAEGETLVTVGKGGVVAGTTKLTKDGFVDNGKVVLSANPNLVVSEADAAQMRTFLSVYSKAEIDAKLAGVYHVKGSVANFAALPADAVVGDVYNVKAAGGTDIHGNAIKAGDNVVYVDAKGDDPAGWDVLSGLVDLSAYYTSEQVNTLLADYAKTTEVDAKLEAYAKSADVYTKTAADDKFATKADTYTKTEIDGKVTTINQSIADAKKAGTDAQAAVDALEPRVETLENAGYQTAADVNKILSDGNYVQDANYVHTDNNYDATAKGKVDKIITTGDGTKVLKDDGSYDTLEIAVVSI